MQKFKVRLEEERARLAGTIASLEADREGVRLSEAAAEHSSDPDNVDGGTFQSELEKELSLEQNAGDLLEKVKHAIARFEAGTYGLCEICGTRIPVARLDALPYATQCVTCASAR